MMKTTAHITIPGHPVTKKNSQVIGRTANGRAFILPSRSYQAYERAALRTLRAYQGPRFSGPVHVTVHYWLRDRRRPDLANLMAATADILERAGVIDNDRNITSWDGTRIMGTSDNPRAEIIIRPGGEHDVDLGR